MSMVFRLPCQILYFSDTDNIFKDLLLLSGGAFLSTDISLGTANGIAAVHYISWQVSRLPAIRPLTLVIKALLRVCSGLRLTRLCACLPA